MIICSVILGLAWAQEEPNPDQMSMEQEGVQEEETKGNEEKDARQAEQALEILKGNLSEIELKKEVGLLYTYVFSEGEKSGWVGKEYTLDTPFEIGSVSKVFTSLLLSQLVTQEEVSLDTTIKEILPEVKMRPEVATITLKQLATHTSGLPKLPPNLGMWYILRHAADPYAEYDRKKLHKGVSKAKRTEKVGTYSNFGVGLLGDLLSVKMGKDYCSLIEEHIAKPWKMSSLQCSSIPEGLAQPHLWTGAENPAWRFDALAGAGALRANSADMAHFLRQTNVDDISDEEMKQTMQRTLEAHHEEGKRQVGLGWMMENLEGEQCYWHNGMTGGTSSFVAYCPQPELGLVLLMNQQDLKFTLTNSGIKALKELIIHDKAG